MGIPTYFRTLLEENNNIISVAQQQPCDEKKSIDFFFLDFNAIIYTVFANTTFSNEEGLLHNIILELKKLCDLVEPKKAMYIAVDGTAPKAKMVQQRSRRFKSLQLDYYKETLIEEEVKKRKTFKDTWNPANNICPGTEFMMRLNRKILSAMKQKIFNVPKVILNGVETPGEGEHKILPHIRKLQNTDDSIVIFSPDNDILSLSLLTQKNNIFILRYMDVYSFNILAKSKNFNYHYDSKTNLYYLPKIYISIDNIKSEFKAKFKQKDEINTIIDYNFLLAMVGNDFVPSLPYMKIRNGGLNNLIRIYKNVKKDGEYLIDKKTLRINLPFFIDIVKNLSNMEDSEMKKLQSTIQHEKTQPLMKNDNIMTTLEHCYMFNSNHPLYSIYENDFEKIDYSLQKHEWKGQYYQYFFNVDPQNYSQYNQLRSKVVRDYLESLVFTLKYYNTSCPSWTWYYKNRVAPLFSDVYTVLQKQHFDMNSISFTLGKPYTPFQQLLNILPKESHHILPKEYLKIFQKYQNFYVDVKTMKVDAFSGLKYIYSEAILPEMEYSNFHSDIKKIENIHFNPNNVIRDKVYRN